MVTAAPRGRVALGDAPCRRPAGVGRHLVVRQTAYPRARAL